MSSLFSQSLWDFALEFYARPQVADTCLKLQDDYGANVCLMIGLHWLDTRGQRLDNKQLLALDERLTHWMNEVVLPLRSLRRMLKSSIENFSHDDAQEQLRTAVKQAELLAEKKLLIEIESWVNVHIKSAQNTDGFNGTQGVDNLERYLKKLGVPDALSNRLSAICLL